MHKDTKKVLITGASRGIGKNIALKSKEKGYEVLGTSTSQEGADKLKEEGINGIKLDLNNQKSIDSFKDLITAEHSDISVLVNNAGITRDNIVLRMTEIEWSEVLNVHLNGTFFISKAILKFMLRMKWGRIINISSTSASLGNKGQANYAAAKSGVEAFTRSLAKEVGSRNITVNAVAPGYVKTDMTESLLKKTRDEILSQIPLLRFGKVEEISELVIFLYSEEASYITGQTLHVNGGLYM